MENSKLKKLEPPIDEKGIPILTKKFIQQCCEKNELFITPHLNTMLYLHYIGIRKITNLEEYTDVRCLYMQNNAIEKIEGLDRLIAIRCLYLQSNCITEIGGLDCLKNLNTLNLSHNFIKKLTNLDKLTVLETLDVSYNHLSCADDISGLSYCPSITDLNISNNQIETEDGIIELLGKMKYLCLYMSGNDFVKAMQNYRKKVINAIKSLVYLDDMPVKETDKIFAEAFAQGGIQSEKEARRKYAEDKKEEIRKEKEATKQHFEMMVAKKKKALEQIHKEYLEKREALLKRKQELEDKILNKEDVNMNNLRLQYIDAQIQTLEEQFNDDYKKPESGKSQRYPPNNQVNSQSEEHKEIPELENSEQEQRMEVEESKAVIPSIEVKTEVIPSTVRNDSTAQQASEQAKPNYNIASFELPKNI